MSSSRSRSLEPDLFSTASAKEPVPLAVNSPPPVVDGGANAASPPYALPINLPSALKHLDDDQLDRLLSAVLAERQARGGKKLPKPDKPHLQKRSKEVSSPPLAQGKLNAVRVAFKSGVRPSRIVREFGISHADVRRAFAGDGKK
jgi:hypothetical protein